MLYFPMTRIFHWFFIWKMDPMSGCDTPTLVFTLEPKDSTLQYKKCVHLWNNFPCLTSLMWIIKTIKIKCFYPPRILNEHHDASILVYKFRPERTGFNMYATAINFPCIITLVHKKHFMMKDVLINIKGLIFLNISLPFSPYRLGYMKNKYNEHVL